eukprot:2029794-Heterocapsa_arctica.AAC.1
MLPPLRPTANSRGASLPTPMSHSLDHFSVLRYMMCALYALFFGVASLLSTLRLPARFRVDAQQQSTFSPSFSCCGGPPAGSSHARALYPADIALPLHAYAGGGPGYCVAWSTASLTARSPGILNCNCRGTGQTN